MTTLSFTDLHAMCARIANEGTPLDGFWSEPDAEGHRTNIWGGKIRDRDFYDVQRQIKNTISVLGQKQQIVNKWNKENGR